MISEAYSQLRSISSGVAGVELALDALVLLEALLAAADRSPTGMRSRSISESWRMYQGEYSAECSLDSVGK